MTWEISHLLDSLSHEAADNHPNCMSCLGKLSCRRCGDVGKSQRRTPQNRLRRNSRSLTTADGRSSSCDTLLPAQQRGTLRQDMIPPFLFWWVVFELRDGAQRPQTRAATQWDLVTESLCSHAAFSHQLLPTQFKLLQDCVFEDDYFQNYICRRKPALSTTLIWCLWSFCLCDWEDAV